jgi:hypothetical protein
MQLTWIRTALRAVTGTIASILAFLIVLALMPRAQSEQL